MRQHFSRAAINSRNHSIGTELVSGRTVIGAALIEETYKATLRASDDHVGGRLGFSTEDPKQGTDWGHPVRPNDAGPRHNSTQRRPESSLTATAGSTDTRGAIQDNTDRTACPRQDSNLRRPA